MKKSVRIAAAALVLIGVGVAQAGTLTTTNNTNANDLAAALTSGGAGGITITNAVLSVNTLPTGEASSGIYTTSGPNNYQLQGSGIVISSGNAAQDGSTGAFISSVTTDFGTNATAAQTNLLNQVASAPSGWHDVTELTVTFSADANTDHVFFNTVFASAEYPHFVGSFIDGFGLFLNGTNIAFAGGNPVNINSPLMVNTAFNQDGVGVPGTQFQTTPLEGLLVQNGSPVVTYSGAVTPGSTGNTLVFIVGDANDNQLDTAAFIQGLGNQIPPNTAPEPGSLTLLGTGAMAALGYAWRRRKARA
jgi:hypothetical protein